MFYEQPSIELFGIVFDTPVTALTDVFVTVVCWYAYYKISKYKQRNRVKTFLLIYFASMGFATLSGGIIGHGFIHYFDLNIDISNVPGWILSIFSEDYIHKFSKYCMRLPGWLTSMVSIAFIERACIEQAKGLIKPSMSRFFSILNIVELCTFMIISFSTLDFIFVEIHTAYGLGIIVFSFNIFLYRKTKNRGSLKFIQAVIWSAPAAIFFMTGIGIGPWFNHIDVSHIFMMISAWVFYKGSKPIIMAAGNNDQ